MRLLTSVADPDPNPDPDPPDPHVFGSPGSFYYQAKKVRKMLISTALWLLFDFLSFKMMYMYLQEVVSKKLFFKFVFCLHLGKVNDENSRIRGMDPRIQIRIHPEMSWIRNIASYLIFLKLKVDDSLFPLYDEDEEVDEGPDERHRHQGHRHDRHRQRVDRLVVRAQLTLISNRQ